MSEATKFVNFLTGLLTSHFNNVKSNRGDDELKYKLQGYIKAGDVTGIYSHSDSLKLMNRIHLEILGETFDPKKTSKIANSEAKKNKQSDIYCTIPDNTGAPQYKLQHEISNTKKYGFCITSSSGIHCGECEGCLNFF